MFIDWKMPLLPVTTWQMGSGILSPIVSISIGSFRGTHSLGGMIWHGGKWEIRNHGILQRELLVTHLRKACLVRAEALDVFHVLVEIFELLPCRPEHHDGGDVRVGARVTPIRVVVRAHHLRHGDGKLKLPPLVKLQLCR